MKPRELKNLETDRRFPSGPWTGFFIQPWIPGRHKMFVDLTFKDGELKGRGDDRVGTFTFSGTYDTADGKCRWTKNYLGKHQVSYAGFNEGKGIWGVWNIRILWGLYHDRGVFHLWPEGMTPDADADLTERALLDDVGRLPPFQIVVAIIFFGLLATVYFFLRFRSREWIEDVIRWFQ